MTDKLTITSCGIPVTSAYKPISKEIKSSLADKIRKFASEIIDQLKKAFSDYKTNGPSRAPLLTKKKKIAPQKSQGSKSKPIIIYTSRVPTQLISPRSVPRRTAYMFSS